MAKTKTPSFEQAFNRLETIARELESGEVALEDALTLYEEGMKLIDLCGSKLNAAEKRIRKLSKSDDDSFAEDELE